MRPGTDRTKDAAKDSRACDYAQENREAEKLALALESPLGAQQLGDEAYELVKQEMAET